MVKRVDAGSDGLYHVGGASFKMNIGSRAQVWHKTARKTAGGLSRSQLKMNKHGRIVSRKKHGTAKKEKRLEKAGYKTRKGKFGFVLDKSKKSSKRKSRKSRKSRAGQT